MKNKSSLKKMIMRVITNFQCILQKKLQTFNLNLRSKKQKNSKMILKHPQKRKRKMEIGICNTQDHLSKQM